MATATPPPAARATAWARSRAWPTICEIYSAPGLGTAIVARFRAPEPAASTACPRSAPSASPMPGETVCGDDWASRETAQAPHRRGGRRARPRRRSGRAADIAVRASSAACRGFAARTIVERIHARAARRRAARRSRSRASIAAARRCASPASATSPRHRRWRRHVRHMVSHNGTARARRRAHPASSTIRVPSGALVMLHSDGLAPTGTSTAIPACAPPPGADRRRALPRLSRAGATTSPCWWPREAREEPSDEHSPPHDRASRAETRRRARPPARARQIAALLGFDAQDQTRIATAVSEIARNAFHYAGGGQVEFRLEGDTRRRPCVIRITRRGPGHRRPDGVLDGPLPLGHRHGPGHRSARSG